jgi:hypothetical protein
MSRMTFGTQTITVKRCVDVCCASCRGVGQRLYGSTATWRGGIGGAAMTEDVCDVCWGTGDSSHPGYDIRKHEAGVSRLVEQRAARLLERSMGAGIGILKGAQEECAAALDTLARKRKHQARETPDLATLLAKTLRAMAEAGRSYPS